MTGEHQHDRSSLRTSTPARVLIVDDQDDLRDVLRLRLRGRPDVTVVGEAENGEIAIELCRALEPDIVFLDIVMPVMTGLEALPLIRDVVPRTHVIVHTSRTDEQTRQAAMRSGADQFVIKGGSRAVLWQALDEALS